MAPTKRLGVGAECTVSLRFLHPKDKVKQRIPNQTRNQQLSSLIAQGQAQKTIRKQQKLCVVFRHEDFGAQPIWCLPQYAKVDNEGPASAFFEQTGAAEAAGPGAAGAGGGEDTSVVNDDDNNNNAAGHEEEELLPGAIQAVLDRAFHLDNDDIQEAAATIQADPTSAAMVDNDNMPAPENIPTINENSAADDIMIGWLHNGICNRKTNVATNAKPGSCRGPNTTTLDLRSAY